MNESEQYNNILNRIEMLKLSCYDPFIIGDYCYAYDYGVAKYCRFLTKSAPFSYAETTAISREELIDFLTAYLRRIKLERIKNKI